MELTRRDALAALAAGGVAVGTGAVVFGDREDVPDDIDLDALVALARVVYPSEVTGIPAFVRRYSLGRVENRGGYREGMASALSELDEYARDWFDAPFVGLDPSERDRLLREMGVRVATPDPAGDAPARVRYYLVNELLYALYTTPTGGKLVGIENPQGHPGGTDSYQRGPQ